MPLKLPTPVRRWRGASRAPRQPAGLVALLALLVAACGGGGGGGGTGGDRAQLQLTVSGLPAGTAATVTVSGPNGFARSVSTSGAITGLQPGTYAIAATTAENDTARYAPTPFSQSITLAEGETKPAQVAYAVSTGRIAVSITGLPPGVNGSVLVERTPNFAQTLAASAILSKLQPGTYTVTADTIASGGTTYPGTPYTRTVGVVASYTPAQAPVTYAPQPGALRVTVNGLPPAIPASITVTGPGGYNQAVTSTTTLQPLASGTYTVSAMAATSGGDVFNPAPPTQQVSVTTGGQSQATVTYASANGETLNLSIGRFYITQSVQRPDNSVPLVAGRPALVRVFVVANEANSAQPEVRYQIYQGATLVREDVIGTSAGAVPISIDEGTTATSWNFSVEGGFLQPGMRIQIVVDPANAIPESAESDNTLTLGAEPLALDIREVPPFRPTIVPILEPSGALGDATDENTARYLDFPTRIFPLSDVDVEVRAPFSTTVNLQPNGTNWETALSELDAARVAQGSSRYWYGVVEARCAPTGCVAGIGYRPGNPLATGYFTRTALGWDNPSDAGEISAHEWGHNFGRAHVACTGTEDSPYLNYPYTGGRIGVWGMDVGPEELKDPTAFADVMTYCSNQWVSDFIYTGILNFRSASATAVSGGSVEGMLVWGRVTDGVVTLEPAFNVSAPIVPSTGDWVVDVLDEAGHGLARHRFYTTRVEDLPGDHEHFAFVLPLDQARRDRVAALRVSGPGGAAERRATPMPPGARAVAPVPAVERAGNRTRLRWDPSRFGAALVRDAATGEVLTIARGGGAAEVAGARGDLDVTFSDGVRSVRARVTR